MSSINLVSEEMVLQESVMSDRAKQDLMLGGSIPGSEVPWSLSHARAVGCSSVVSLRTSSRPLAMEEIFSFWAAARFSKKRALQDGVDVGQKQSRDGDNRDNQ